jgi:hypothetical protein
MHEGVIMIWKRWLILGFTFLVEGAREICNILLPLQWHTFFTTLQRFSISIRREMALELNVLCSEEVHEREET